METSWAGRRGHTGPVRRTLLRIFWTHPFRNYVLENRVAAIEKNHGSSAMLPASAASVPRSPPDQRTDDSRRHRKIPFPISISLTFAIPFHKRAQIWSGDLFASALPRRKGPLHTSANPEPTTMGNVITTPPNKVGRHLQSLCLRGASLMFTCRSLRLSAHKHCVFLPVCANSIIVYL
jgi:hypothetical protein